ncbi:MAG: hypothetical protein K6357_05000 [Elusimicrobiota bacterium]
MKRRIILSLVALFYPFFLFSQYIDPEIEKYFEKKYGYLSENGFRDSPVSTVSKDFASEVNKNQKIITYSLLPQPDYTETPLHYDLKKQNTTGAISYYILNPTSGQDTNFINYVAIDISLQKRNYASVINTLSKKYGFILAGEETYLNDSESIVVFGWIDEKAFSNIKNVVGIDKFSFSKREMKAPMTSVSLTIKIPNNRDIVVFSEKFVEKLSEYGFVKKSLEILSSDKKYRFTFIKINGSIPIDKTKILLKYPFVVEAKS